MYVQYHIFMYLFYSELSAINIKYIQIKKNGLVVTFESSFCAVVSLGSLHMFI